MTLWTIGYLVIRLLNDYTVGDWAVADNQFTNYWYFFVLYFLFTTLSGVSYVLRVQTAFDGGVKSVTLLFYNMVYSSINAPINLFYDINPISRVLNKFSNDLAILENDFPF